MAACAITTGGTNGTLRIDYDLGANHNVEYTNYGDDIWIDDTATNVTYTTLTGDVTASSGCVTITALPMICYQFSYDRPKAVNDVYVSNFTAAVVGVTTYSLTSVPDQLAYTGTLINEINNDLADSAIKITAYRITDIDGTYFKIDLIMRIMGSDVPYLKIVSPNSSISYLKGIVSADCIPTGYQEVIFSETPAL